MDWDDAYANAAHISGAESYPPRWEADASAFRAQAHGRLGLAYGTGARERFDLFLPASEAAGLVVFIHGGYWMKFDHSYWSHLATGPLARGWAVAMPSYDLCPDLRISGITAQIARAIEAAANEVTGPIAVTGHSAGGHLSARMLERGLLSDDAAARLRKVVPISPLSDLRPLMRTSMNDTLHIDAAEAQQESPVFMTDRLNVPVTVWVGGDERPAFLDQANWLGEAWGCDVHIKPGRHHFDVIDALADKQSRLVDALVV
ncbi:alpha/beta hydrolase [Rhodalgimonas zhirmunskyi]|uniref:Alpha/beta hydrolase n=1 Tax=Rhodalgimonas zhirmunskyi TaxID=2964767 RepID=A0AAJ1U962_9RHOB|nr:alpha/beta hydrolase [Rhodoalgimonas zhirmunskyi]MDQ2094095.1 alpha/beta hydrolase [Rhodoalgimonas zhirmunskyi]